MTIFIFIVCTKSQLDWLKLPHLTNTAAASDCQTTNGHKSKRSAWRRDRCYWRKDAIM